MSRSVRLRAVVTVLLTLVATAVAVALAPTARASCAFENPPASPYRFTGVVLGTELAQRLAYVATDDGRSVMVRGTESTADDAFTTVDRTYLTGHRYVFHPTNSTSPYLDNICTATMDLGSAPTEQPAAAHATADTELADGAPADGALRAWILLAAAAGVVLLLTGVLLVRRSRPSTAEHTPEPEAADRPAPGHEN